ncbi:MAG: hypothetical protein PHE86_00535 [Candidatus Marinimicrobia bacterium]|nr:hypothetical protein [Candidatus Neomarinimicrobiota bacterium]MDD5582043.1 hypothetical protein [Candidatus Neomarinimicrobiota bacterium]
MKFLVDISRIQQLSATRGTSKSWEMVEGGSFEDSDAWKVG